MRIYFARYGEKEDNGSGFELSEHGERQIYLLARRLKQEKINVHGVFIEIGGLPVSDITKMLGVKIDKDEYVIVDEEMKTNVPGVFAAGDIVKSKLKQVIVAASQGALAAKSAREYLG